MVDGGWLVAKIFFNLVDYCYIGRKGFLSLNVSVKMMGFPFGFLELSPKA